MNTWQIFHNYGYLTVLTLCSHISYSLPAHQPVCTSIPEIFHQSESFTLPIYLVLISLLGGPDLSLASFRLLHSSLRSNSEGETRNGTELDDTFLSWWRNYWLEMFNVLIDSLDITYITSLLKCSTLSVPGMWPPCFSLSLIQILLQLFMKLTLFVDEIFIESKIYEDAKNRFDYPPLNCGF